MFILSSQLINSALISLVLVSSLSAQTTDKYSDANRPYEFGFNIEGQQHRHEAKDTKGLITGEFGFITADGVYHVTVYATDENGRFIILSMKSIKVSPPLDGSGDQTPISTPDSIKQIFSGKPTTTRRPTTNAAPTLPPSLPGGVFTTPEPLAVASCGSCAIPSTTLGPPGSDPHKFVFQTAAFQKPQKDPKPSKPELNQIGGTPPGKLPINNFGKPHVDIPNLNSEKLTTSNNFGKPPIQETNNVYTNPNQDYLDNHPIDINEPNIIPPNQELLGPLPPSSNNPHQQYSTEIPNQLFNRPITGTNVNIPSPSPSMPETEIKPTIPGFLPQNPVGSKPLQGQVPQDTYFPGLIHPPGNSETQQEQQPTIEGQLPPGLTTGDMLHLLYRFNYTVGFHGHYETGYRNGAKIGGYFVNGRDGISRIVEYTADDRGFRPKITYVNLGLNSPNTPKEETEQNYGLKGQIFEWFSLR